MARRSLLTIGAVLMSVVGASADSEPYIGEIMVFGSNYCPRGWAAADGSLRQIQYYTALFSLVGTNFGGDGMNNFGLPKQSVIAAPTASGPATTMSVCIATTGNFPARP